MADAEVHLFQTAEIDISPTTLLADLEAIEADFTGYAAAVIAAWTGPMMAPVSGAAIQTPMLEFGIDAPYTVPNSIMGWWLQTTGGDLIGIATFPAPVSMTGAGDFITFAAALVVGANS